MRGISQGGTIATLCDYGDHARELELLVVRTVEVGTEKLGEENALVLSRKHRLASVYYRQGRWREANVLLEQAVAARLRVPGPEHPDTLSSQSNLAVTYNYQARWNDAISLEEQVLRTRIKVLGEDGEEHRSTLRSMYQLAITWSPGRQKPRMTLESNLHECELHRYNQRKILAQMIPAPIRKTRIVDLTLTGRLPCCRAISRQRQ